MVETLGQEKRQIDLFHLSQHEYRIFLYNTVSLPVRSGKRPLSCFSLGSNESFRGAHVSVRHWQPLQEVAEQCFQDCTIHIPLRFVYVSF